MYIIKIERENGSRILKSNFGRLTSSSLFSWICGVASLEICAVIPARGGSKGIPKKNLQLVGGLSLVARAILACRGAGIKQIIVTSDSLEILNEANRYGALGHLRSEVNSSDISSSEAAISEVIDSISVGNQNPELIVFVQPTSPFLFSSDIKRCVLDTTVGHSTFTAYEMTAFVWENHADHWEPLGHSKLLRQRRQESKKRVVENGGCYVFCVLDFLITKSRFSNSVKPIIVPKYRSMEVDTFDDLVEAQEISCRIRCDWEA
jgi:N-acylneuraminate cytidylyltransferase